MVNAKLKRLFLDVHDVSKGLKKKLDSMEPHLLPSIEFTDTHQLKKLHKQLSRTNRSGLSHLRGMYKSMKQTVEQ